jgi:dipeptidyl aminopeptidase/acylaminoacyl peptidase
MPLSDLQNISIIKEVREIEVSDLKDTVFQKYPEPDLVWSEISQNSQHTTVYRFKYISNNHLVVGFLLEPKNLDPGFTPLPCIIFNRGGNRDFGKIAAESLFRKKMYPLIENGFVVIMSQYSGVDGGEGKDEFGGSELNDVLVLKEILDQYTLADDNRIGMYGVSRGGMMTYLASSKVDWIKAAVIKAGAANHQRQFFLRPEMYTTCKEMFDVDDVHELEKRSPMFLASQINKTTGFLILHGTSDWRVSVLDSLDMACKLYENRVPYRLQIYPGADHALSEVFQESMASTVDWFNRYVKNLEPLPSLELHGK